jgi:tRNA A-37 threonylcarbamoyl transferase component Bud32
VDALELPLAPSFRYIHEPLRAAETALGLLGNADLVEELKQRVVHSYGGAFLVTGFRGVGKTTLILRALDDIIRCFPTTDFVLPVVLSAARPMSTEQLLFTIVRRAVESLTDHSVLDQIPPDVRQSLLLAYTRTSLALKEMRSEAAERGASVTVGPRPAGGPGVLVPQAGLSARRTRSLATEASFLTYSETDVEHDLIRIVRLMGDAGAAGRLRSRPRHRWPWQRPPLGPVHLLVVIDEVDKLTTTPAGLERIEELLTGVKNVLTTSGVHFLVVAGPDLHDHVVKDASRGNSVYESVFAWRLYVPCVWDAPERLLDQVLPRCTPSADSAARPGLEKFASYLRYKARGIPRRLLQEFSGFVMWDGDRPLLRIAAHDSDRIAFYARLEEIISAHVGTKADDQLFPIRIDEDRWRLSGYYVVDWILRSEGQPFTVSDIMTAEERTELDPLLHLSRRPVDRLLGLLVEQEVIEIVRNPNANSTLIGDAPESQLISYKLADDVKRTLLGLARDYEDERAALDLAPVPQPTGQAGVDVAETPIRTIAGRYTLLEVIGQGGTSTVYRGRDEILQRTVAVKVLHPIVASDANTLARFEREMNVTARLNHPNVVRTFDIVRDDAAAIVMELVEGRTLLTVLAHDGPLPPNEVARLGLALAGVLDYLEHMGLSRVDIKPSNIIMSPDRGPVIIDFGLVRGLIDTSVTQTGVLIGTPAYMSPEMARGEPADIRSDIFSLGLVIYTCLTGAPPWATENPIVVLTKIINTQLDVSGLPGSTQFRAVIARATERNVAQRFQHAADVRAALLATPEGAAAGQD